MEYGGNQVFKHLDLPQKLEIQINGPIQVTALHLGFRENELQYMVCLWGVCQMVILL